MQHFLVLTVMGANRPGLLDSISRLIKDSGGNIIDGRVTQLGQEFVAMLLVAGTWDTIAKLESASGRAAAELQVLIQTKRTSERSSSSDSMPYAVEVVAVDRPGIVYDIASFFYRRNIAVEEVYSNTYKAAHTGTPMCSLHINISVPTDTSIAGLRGEFLDFCDQLNLDSILEPVK